jgi:hypothetical protein
MKPTTASQTVIEKIKARAKAIKQTEGISHAFALERSAKEFGYVNWHQAQSSKAPFANVPSILQELEELVKSPPGRVPQRFVDEIDLVYMQYLSGKGSAVRIERVEPKGDYFHEVLIDGVKFRGVVTLDGPAILGVRYEGVDVGSLEIHLVPTPYKAGADPTWHVCKYEASQPRIDLAKLTRAGLLAFSHEFGVPILSPDSSEVEAGEKTLLINTTNRRMFPISPAFANLKKWAAQHPRKAKQNIRGWPI